MPYEKINFKPNNILMASELNHMETAIDDLYNQMDNLNNNFYCIKLKTGYDFETSSQYTYYDSSSYEEALEAFLAKKLCYAQINLHAYAISTVVQSTQISLS